MRIAFLNPQGNFDSKNRYWTQHPDFGGQLVYVKEVAQAMALAGNDVEIFTRQIVDAEWPGFESSIDTYPGYDNLKIVRIPFGGDGFLRKEDLWCSLHEFAVGIRDYYASAGYKPDFFTAHYADGGWTAVLLQQMMGIPFTFTGHSLGAQKLDKLGVTPENLVQLDEEYRFTRRIAAERMSMRWSAVNVVSTEQERFEQYNHQVYQGTVDVNNDGRFEVIPPGVNTKIFYPPKCGELDNKLALHIEASFARDLQAGRRGLPSIIASSRLEPKKNHIGLLKAYAESSELQQLANLIIGLRGLADPFRDFHKLKGAEGQVLAEIIALVEQYGLKGKVGFLDLQNQEEIAECYRYMVQRGGVFALTALYEPFGLAPLEAAACGLPIVVTKNGGPQDSFQENGLQFGLLVDPESPADIGRGLLSLFSNRDFWWQMAKAGYGRVKSKYTWESTAAGYLRAVRSALENAQSTPVMEELNLPQLAKLLFAGGEEK